MNIEYTAERDAQLKEVEFRLDPDNGFIGLNFTREDGGSILVVLSKEKIPAFISKLQNLHNKLNQ